MFIEKPEGHIMPDRIYETYAIHVGILNSLNAINGEFRRKNSEKYDPSIASLLERTQYTINYLLEETGRNQEWKDWEKEHKKYGQSVL